MAISAASRTAALARRTYSNKIHMQLQEQVFWLKNGFMGPDVGEDGSQFNLNYGYPLIYQENLGKGKGEYLTLPYLAQLTGAGKTANTALIDQEEDMAFSSVVLRLEQLRHATGSLGPLGVIAQPLISKENQTILLTNWMTNQMENGLTYTFYNRAAKHMVDASLETATAHPNEYFGLNRAGFGDMEDTDTFGVALLDDILTWTVMKNISPIKTPDGKKGFVVMAHPYQINGLMQDDAYRNYLSNARPRDKNENPIWTNADHCYRGLYIYETTRVMRPDETPHGAVAGYTNLYGAIVLGANAVAVGQGGVGKKKIDRLPYDIVKADQTDYENYQRYGIRSVWGARRMDWTPQAGGSDVNQSSAIFWTAGATASRFA